MFLGMPINANKCRNLRIENPRVTSSILVQATIFRCNKKVCRNAGLFYWAMYKKMTREFCVVASWWRVNVLLQQETLTNKKPAIKAGFFYWRFRDESSARFSNVMIDGCVEL